MLRVNRNSLVMIDSDKRNQQTQLNDTKQRIIYEINANSGLAWVTKGREVENYIPTKVVARWLKLEESKIKQPEQYADFFEYLNGVEKGKGTYYGTRKPLMAEELGPHFLKDDLNEVLDLSQRLDELCAKIRQWNNL